MLLYYISLGIDNSHFPHSHVTQKKVYPCSSWRGSERRAVYRLELDAEREHMQDKRLICTPTYFHSANANKSARLYAKTSASLKRFMQIAMSCTQNVLFQSVKLHLEKNPHYFDCRELHLSSMNFVTYEILDRCPNDCEIKCTIQFRPRMSSNESRGVNIMALPDRSGSRCRGLKTGGESHRSVAQSRRLCNQQWEAN